MFKFSFSNDDVEDLSESKKEEKKLLWFESREIFAEQVSLQEKYNSNLIKCDKFDIKYVCDEDVVSALRHKSSFNEPNSVIKAEQHRSDLITAVYEGGLKIWECTFDLLNFLENMEVDFTQKKVLDLGCGAGIIGIYAAMRGSSTVFQDYVMNSEVIQSITIPNVFLNKINFQNCQFYCGDWESFLELLKIKLTENEKFDYIFTCETIYNIHNYNKIYNIFRQLLKKNGIIYLAAKCHYFGVGGGIRHFEDTLKMEDIFDHKTCWSCTSGVKREIIEITFK